MNTNAGSDQGADVSPQLATDGQVLFARSTDNGITWSPPAALNTHAASDGVFDDDVSPAFATAQDTWTAVWSRDGTLNDPLGADFGTWQSRSTDGGITWSPPAVSGATADAATGDDEFPEVATDGQGTWVATWSSTDPTGGIGEDADIPVSNSVDGGIAWSPRTILNINAATDTEDDVVPQLAADGQGSWIAVWQSGNPF